MLGTSILAVKGFDIPFKFSKGPKMTKSEWIAIVGLVVALFVAIIGVTALLISSTNDRIDRLIEMIDDEFEDQQKHVDGRIDDQQRHIDGRLDDFQWQIDYRFDDLKEDLREIRTFIFGPPTNRPDPSPLDAEPQGDAEIE